MQIVCPSCNARYLAPDAQIGPNGRRVRCARCSHVWRVVLPEAEAPTADALESTAAAPESEPAPEPPPASPPPGNGGIKVDPLPRNRLPAPADAHKRKSFGGVWWALLAMVVGALAAAFYFGRATVLEVWPASTKLYEAVGLESDAAETRAILAVKQIEHAWDGEDMVFSGVVENSGKTEAAPHFIRIRLFDAADDVVSDKRQRLGDDPIGPGETRPFTIRFERPGDVARARHLLVPVR